MNLKMFKESFFYDDTNQLWNTNKLSLDNYNPFLEDEMYILKNNCLKKQRMSIFGNSLIRFCKTRVKWMSIENCFLEQARNSLAGQGIRITRGQKSFEFYGDVEQWFNYMRQYTIQINFQAQYTLLKKIGKGNFAEVYKAQLKSDQTCYAVKCFRKVRLQEIDKPAILKEIGIMRKIQHESVLRLFEVFESEEYVYLVVELLKGGELNKLLKKSPPFSEEKTSKIIYKLLKAIQNIHENGILHRDLKPENIILREQDNVENFCIADFGLADYYNPTGNYMFTRCGTPGYVAPELLQDQLYDQKVDIYSIGILMYLMVCGKQPFEGPDYDSIVMKNYYGQVDFEQLKLSQIGMEFIKGLLSKNPSKRLTAQEALTHSWFVQEKLTKLCQFKIRKPMIINKRLSTQAQSINLSPISPVGSMSPMSTHTRLDDDSPKTPKMQSLRKSTTTRKSIFNLMKI